MTSTGLLVLTQPLCHVRHNLPRYLAELNKQITKTAYIHVHPGLVNDSSTSQSHQTSRLVNFMTVPLTVDVRNLVKDVYVSSVRFCGNKDIQVLVGHYGNSETSKCKKYNFIDPCDVVLVDRNLSSSDQDTFIQCVRDQFNVSSAAQCKILQGEQVEDFSQEKKPRLDEPPQVCILSL